jgi:hypothetical protein
MEEEKYFGRVEHFPKQQEELTDIFNAALTPRCKWWKNPIKFIKSKLIKEPEWTLLVDLTQSKIVQDARQARLDKLAAHKYVPGVDENDLESILLEHYRSLEMTQAAIQTLEQKIKRERKGK